MGRADGSATHPGVPDTFNTAPRSRPAVARRRRNPAVRNPLRPDVRALEAAEVALDAHRESFDDAKRARDAGIENGRDALRSYKQPLFNAVTNRRKGLERQLKALDHYDEPLQAAKSWKKRGTTHAGSPRPGTPLARRARATAVDAGAKHLVELKARYEDLGKARALLAGAERVGIFAQIDTYFSLGERRLKLRAIDGQKEGQLVYYERPNVGGVKESRVRLATLPDAGAVRDILVRILPAKAEIRKTREIYHFQGVQVHLDVVAGLGKFLELEKVLADEAERGEARKQLESLRAYFQIPDEDLMASSYSDFFESG